MIDTSSAHAAIGLDTIRKLVALETATRIRRDAKSHPKLHWISVSSHEGCRLFVRSAPAASLAKVAAALKFVLLDVRKMALTNAVEGWWATRIELAPVTVEQYGDQIVVTARARIGGAQ